METTTQFVRDLIFHDVVEVVFIDDVEPSKDSFVCPSLRDEPTTTAMYALICDDASDITSFRAEAQHCTKADPLACCLRSAEASPDATVCSISSFSPVASAVSEMSPGVLCAQTHHIPFTNEESLNLSIESLARHVVVLANPKKGTVPPSLTETRHQTVAHILQQLLDSGYADESSMILMLILLERCVPQSPSFLSWSCLRRTIIATLQLVAKNYGDVYYTLDSMSAEAGLWGCGGNSSSDKIDMIITCQWKVYAALEFSVHVSMEEFEGARHRLCNNN